MRVTQKFELSYATPLFNVINGYTNSMDDSIAGNLNASSFSNDDPFSTDRSEDVSKLRSNQQLYMLGKDDQVKEKIVEGVARIELEQLKG